MTVGSRQSETLERQRQAWNDLAALDPLWAIYSNPERRYGRWEVDEFLLTGEAEVAAVLEIAETVGYPKRRDATLDFGCGVGRATRALSTRFARAVGVDLSGEMIERAKRLNHDRENCVFLVNDAADLSLVESESFDLVYSNLVLQHMPSRRLACAYISEFLRVVRPDGLVVFQVPFRVPLRGRIQAKRRLYAVLRRLGVSRRVLYERLRLNPMRTISVPDSEVERAVSASGGTILRREETDQPNPSFQYYVRPAGR